MSRFAIDSKGSIVTPSIRRETDAKAKAKKKGDAKKKAPRDAYTCRNWQQALPYCKRRRGIGGRCVHSLLLVRNGRVSDWRVFTLGFRSDQRRQRIANRAKQRHCIEVRAERVRLKGRA